MTQKSEGEEINDFSSFRTDRQCQKKRKRKRKYKESWAELAKLCKFLREIEKEREYQLQVSIFT